MVDYVHHLVLQLAARLPALGRVDRLLGGEPRQTQTLADPQAVKLDPDIFPRVGLVGHIGGGLVRQNQKAVSAVDLVHLLIGIQRPPPPNHIVEQIMVPLVGAIGMQRFGALPSVLVQCQIHKPLVLKHMKFELVFGMYIFLIGHTIFPLPRFFYYIP